MSLIRICRHCQRPYWRYRRDHPPAFYCSVPCADAGPGQHEAPPERPSIILARLQEHLAGLHARASLTDWPRCQTCEVLEEEYAISRDWYYQNVVPVEPFGAKNAGGGASSLIINTDNRTAARGVPQ